MTGAMSFVGRFDELSNGQRELLSQAEHEASAWKDAYSSREIELVELRKELAQLKLAKVESTAANPLLLCLIDGDGCIFNESLLSQGLEGGREAASQLRMHIAGHHLDNADILVHVFFNREGLGKTVKSYLNVQPATFNAFISGFNTASPLMSMLDVGAGKEAADSKIRELMRIFVRYPNVKRIYFGGGHDNGYSNNLATLQNEGYLHKVVLLKSYSQLAVEIKALGLPCLENNGIFLPVKLSARNMAASNAASPAPPMTRGKSANKSPVPPPAQPILPPPSPMKVPGGKNGKANLEQLKALKPRACNDFYLTKRGCRTDDCAYGHDYDLSPDQINVLRDYVKQHPCIQMNKGLVCKNAECPSAHQCPKGPSCNWHKQGNCKFVAVGMHGVSFSSEEEDDRVLVAPALTTLRTHNRTHSSSSSMADFLDYPPSAPSVPIAPSESPAKKFGSARARSTPNARTQLKTAFKSSVSGATTEERLRQMGVGSAGAFGADDDSDSSEQLSQLHKIKQRPGVIAFHGEWDTPAHAPTKYTLF